jgi:outer membrane protein OmpA-like peptidoglycan-associated protein
MRARLASVALALAAALTAGIATAEPVGQRAEFSMLGGYTIFDKDRNQITNRELKDALYLGGRLSWQFPKWFGLELAGGFTPTQEDTVNGSDFDFWHGSANLMWRIVDGRHGYPFISIGGGASQLKPSSGGGKDTQGNGEIAAGVVWWLSDQVGLRFEGRDIMWLPANSPSDVASNDYVVSAGLNFAIGGKARDSDEDGVPDRKDKCANTPKGAKVDDTGCPIDLDGDGVPDGIDQCPGTPKGSKVDAKGCTLDADGDGVPDGVDACPDTPKGATVDAKGCPSDADDDGVYDGIDKCPNTPKGAQVDSVGCPSDFDKDGVPDGLDKCPDTQAGLRVDVDGCPIEITEKETELLDTGMIRLHDVNFETGKATLLAESNPALDDVGNILKKWPELKIEIGGHTDSRGSDALNKKLSEQRAQSVLNYLTQKFPELNSGQFTVKGYGESTPIVPNTTPLNMSKNRRVEFKVLNRETLKREIERRKLLEK